MILPTIILAATSCTILSWLWLAPSSPVTRGHFRLAYGGAVSGCMDVNSAESAAGGYSVKSRLQELEEVFKAV